MSVLETNSPLTAKVLTGAGFEQDSWGSRYTRTHSNATMFEKIINQNGAPKWQVLYFPPEFTGYVNLGGLGKAEVSGRVVMAKINSPHSSGNYYVSSVVEDLLDITVFIGQVRHGNYPNYHEQYGSIFGKH